MYTALGCKITNPDMVAAIALQMREAEKREEARAPKVRREQDDSADWMAWVSVMERRPGFFVPCELMPNWLNRKLPSQVARGIVKMQRRTAYARTITRPGAETAKPPFAVTITRLGPSQMDDDGNSAALKHVRDGVARGLGIDDGDEERIRFKTAYEHAKFYGYRVVIESTDEGTGGG